jgi:hypothetical protein
MSAVPSKKNAWYLIPEGCETLRHLPTAAALADFSAARLAINSLAAQGVEDIEGALAAGPLEAARILDLVSLTWFNDEGRRIFGPDNLPISGTLLRERMGTEGLVAFRRMLVGLDSGDDWVDTAASALVGGGKRLSFRVRASWLAGH